MAIHSQRRLLVMDIIKLVASFFVVFIHCQFHGDIGVAVKAIARFAVPFFFLCSGYFLYGNNYEKIVGKLTRIVKLYLSALLLYALFRFTTFAIGDTLSNAVQQFLNLFTWRSITFWLIFNANIFSGHLWYLDAMIYVYTIHVVIQRLRISEKFVYITSFIFLGLHLLIWHLIVTSNSYLTDNTFVVRNFLFSGYPLVGIGMCIRKYREKIPHLSCFTMLSFIALGEVLVILSRYFIGNKSVPAGAIIIAVTLICYATQTNTFKVVPWMQNSGTYSTYIYVLHPINITVVGFIGRYLSIPESSVVWVNLMPFLVCLSSLLEAIILHYITKQFRHHRP